MVSPVAGDLLHIQKIVAQIQSVGQAWVEAACRSAVAFVTQPITPAATLDFENDLKDSGDECSRQVMEIVLNSIEPDSPEDMPRQVELESQQYSRKKSKTNNRGGIGTLFGTVSLSRYSYEPLSEARDDGHTSIAPLEMRLGIVEGNATPALAERLGHISLGKLREKLASVKRQFVPSDFATSFLPGRFPAAAGYRVNS